MKQGKDNRVLSFGNTQKWTGLGKNLDESAILTCCDECLGDEQSWVPRETAGFQALLLWLSVQVSAKHHREALGPCILWALPLLQPFCCHSVLFILST